MSEVKGVNRQNRESKKRGRDGHKKRASSTNPCGFPGALVTCDDKKEQKALHEVTDILISLMDEKFPVAQNHTEEVVESFDSVSGGPDVKKSKSIAEEIQDELKELGVITDAEAASKAKKYDEINNALRKKRALWLEINARGMGFVSIREPSINVLDLVNPLFEKVLEEKRGLTRFTTRILPLQIVLPFSLDGMATEFARLMGELPASENSLSYRIETRARNNTTYNRSLVVEAITKVLRNSGRKLHVNLETSDLIFLVEVFNGTMGLSLLDGALWDRFERYNIRICAESEDEKNARMHFAAEAQRKGEQQREEKEAAIAAAKEKPVVTATGKKFLWFAKGTVPVDPEGDAKAVAEAKVVVQKAKDEVRRDLGETEDSDESESESGSDREGLSLFRK